VIVEVPTCDIYFCIYTKMIFILCTGKVCCVLGTFVCWLPDFSVSGIWNTVINDYCICTAILVKKYTVCKYEHLLHVRTVPSTLNHTSILSDKK
jgi:hypothetical protein